MIASYASPEAWAAGADRAYEALSAAVVVASPTSLRGLLVADLGAGTGATSRAIVTAGGTPVAADLSLPMLSFQRAQRAPAVVADIASLPLASASVGAAVAAFSLSHVDDPRAVLAEAARVTRGGGPVVAGVFATTGVRHPAKPIIEALAASRGWSPPNWYVHLKELEPVLVADGAFAQLAQDAGLAEVVVRDLQVDANLKTPEALVAWRLSVPAMAPFVASLAPDDRAALIADAIDALGPSVQPLRPDVRVMSGVVPA